VVWVAFFRSERPRLKRLDSDVYQAAKLHSEQPGTIFDSVYEQFDICHGNLEGKGPIWPHLYAKRFIQEAWYSCSTSTLVVGLWRWA